MPANSAEEVLEVLQPHSNIKMVKNILLWWIMII